MAEIMIQDSTAAPAFVATQERRRPGRMENVSPELIALMRKPTAEARRRVAMYDAPNFILPGHDVATRRRRSVSTLHVVSAIGISAGAFGGMFSAMMVMWG